MADGLFPTLFLPVTVHVSGGSREGLSPAPFFSGVVTSQESSTSAALDHFQEPRSGAYVLGMCTCVRVPPRHPEYVSPHALLGDNWYWSLLGVSAHRVPSGAPTLI